MRKVEENIVQGVEESSCSVDVVQQIVAAIDAVVDESHPVRRVSNIVRDVERRVGKPLTHGAAYVFSTEN